MKRQLGPILTALVLLCAPLAWSQSGSTDTTGSSSPAGYFTQSGSMDQSQSPDPLQNADPSQSGSDDSSGQTAGPQASFTHPEQLPPLNLLSDVTAHTGIRLNFNTGTVADYVTGSATAGNYWQTLALFSGGLHLTQIRPTLTWTAGYDAGVSLNSLSSGGSNYTTLNQSGNARIIWEFANHWQFRMKDSYLYSDDPFSPFLSYASEPIPNDPNPILYFPQAITEQNLGTGDITYQFGAHDSINFTGSESFQRYLRTSESLWNSISYGGGAFYEHEFSEKLSVGGGYDFTALDFGHGQSRAGINMMEGFVAYKFNPRTSFSAWIGPELTNTKDIVPVFCSPYGCFYEIQHNSNWAVAEGGTFSWVAPRQAFRALFSHRVTNGGGVLGAVNLYQVSFGYQRTVARAWSLGVAALYNNSLSVSHFRADQYLDSEQGVVTMIRKISDAWNASVYYAFIHQKQNYYLTPGTLSTNGVGLTLRYIWGHSLGR